MLFVDDEPSIRLTLPPILEEQGFQVRVADSIPSALQQVSSHKFDVLLSQSPVSAVLPFMQVMDFLPQRRKSRPDHRINFIDGVLIFTFQIVAFGTSGSPIWGRVSIQVENESRMPRLLPRVTQW